MRDPHPWDETELDGLLCDREGAGDHGLAGDDRRECRNDEQRDRQDGRHHVEEGIVHILRMLEQHCRLAHIVEHQCRGDEVEPRDGDRLAPEMAHVGVKRLSASDRIDYRTERQERVHRVRDEEAPDVDRAERLNNLRVAEDVIHAHRSNRREIDQHDRAEHFADALRAVGLDREQADEDR